MPFSPLNDFGTDVSGPQCQPIHHSPGVLESRRSNRMRGPSRQSFPDPNQAVPCPGRRRHWAAPVIMAGTYFRQRVSKAFFGFAGEVAETPRGEIVHPRPRLPHSYRPPGTVGEVVRALKADMDANAAFYQKCTVFVCGPRPMMDAVVDALRPFFPKGGIHLAREDIMRCGIGICGSCGTETGLRSCVDGPVMRK